MLEYYSVKLNKKISNEIITWLKENCKDHYFIVFATIYFKNEKDHFMFLLRFS